jgi:hypothetical protein
MSLIAKEGGGTPLPLIPAELHQAVCYGLYDLGSHHDEKFDKTTHQCVILWEIPGVRLDIEKDGEKLNVPRIMSKKYTLSLGERANLRKDLKAWRGRDFTPEELLSFDLKKLLGVNCMIQVVHNSKDGKTYSNIGALIPLIKGFPPKKPETEIQFFSMGESLEIPAYTPKWIKEIIESSNEYKGVQEQFGDDNPSVDDVPPYDSDVPF